AGRPARPSTIVGERVILGRLPGSMTSGWPSQVLKLWSRLPSQTPVSPATTPDQPLGVAAMTLPSLSATRQVVVSRASATGGAGRRAAGSAAGLSSGLPARGSP